MLFRSDVSSEEVPGHAGLRRITDWSWNAVNKESEADLTPDVLQPGRREDPARVRPVGPV